MTYVAVAIGGSAILGAASSRSAAKAQAGAADRAGQLQQDQFERNIELNAPFRQAGVAAQNQLLTLLGINPMQDQRGSGGSGVAGMVGSAASNALGQQDSGLRVDPNSPDFGKYARNFAMSDFQADPGYAFRMSEGMKGLERSAAARGGLLSGSMLKGIQRFGQDLGSQEYMNAFNRYQTERNARLNPLQSLAGVGQTTSQQLGAAGQTMASNVGQTMGAAAQARASGYMGGANALTGALGSYMNYNQQQQQNAMLGQLIGNRGVTSSGIGANTYSGQGPVGFAP